MRSDDDVCLPHYSPQWQEIRSNLQHLSECRAITRLISFLDYIEHLVNLKPSPTTSFLQLLPSRETFIGLGNYLYHHASVERRAEFFRQLPKVVDLALAVEQLGSLKYSKAFKGVKFA